MGSMAILIMSVAAFIVVILVMRAIGAWMLRINEVISELKKLNDQIARQNFKG